MEKWWGRLTVFLLVATGTFFNYFLLGGTYLIRAYEDKYYLPTIKLWVMHGVLYGILLAMNWYVFKRIFWGARYGLLFLVTFVLGVVLAWFSPLGIAYYVMEGPIYIQLGDYLRDVHGINWYFMDWGPWDMWVLASIAQVMNFGLFGLGERVFRLKKDRF